MLYLPVHVAGVAVSMLVDTRASHSFVSALFTAMTRLNVDCDVPMVMQLPTGRSKTTDHILHHELLTKNVIFL